MESRKVSEEMEKDLYRVLVSLENEEDCRALLEDLCTRKEVEQFLGCSAFPATNALNSLIREGKIVKTGTARGTRYILADQHIK